MNETSIPLVQPLAYRLWDPRFRSFFYTDARPAESPLMDRWTGLFDKQGLPLYENDIIRVHHDWRLGWVRALVLRGAQKAEYVARATAPEGTVFQIGSYCFADSYRLGNIREHPGKLVAATEQFPAEETQPWWLSPAVFRAVPRSCFN